MSSAGDTITFVDRGVSVKVEGLNRVLRKLNQAGADAENMRALMHSLGGIVIDNAAPPVRSGNLASSMRAGRGKTKAVIRAGYEARTPYAGRIHYGDPAGFWRSMLGMRSSGIQPRPFLTDALQRSKGQVYAALERGIDQLLKQNDLK